MAKPDDGPTNEELLAAGVPREIVEHEDQGVALTAWVLSQYQSGQWPLS